MAGSHHRRQYVEKMQGVIELKADFTRNAEDASTADAIQQKVLSRIKRTLLNGASQIPAAGGRVR